MLDSTSLRALGARVEQYFDWYRRQDPEMPDQAAEVVASFSYLTTHPSRDGARKLLPQTEAFSLGSMWEEMRLALAAMAAA